MACQIDAERLLDTIDHRGTDNPYLLRAQDDRKKRRDRPELHANWRDHHSVQGCSARGDAECSDDDSEIEDSAPAGVSGIVSANYADGVSCGGSQPVADARVLSEAGGVVGEGDVADNMAARCSAAASASRNPVELGLSACSRPIG